MDPEETRFIVGSVSGEGELAAGEGKNKSRKEGKKIEKENQSTEDKSRKETRIGPITRKQGMEAMNKGEKKIRKKKNGDNA